MITLCMMVKDEAHTIARTLRSARPWVDRWLILDTGSTDGTQDVVRAELDGVAGLLFEGPFVDFATSRNALLGAAAKEGGDGFLLLLDADDVLEGGEVLGRFCDDAMPLTEAERSVAVDVNPATKEEAFFVRTSQGSTSWLSARLVRASAVGPGGWHYEGAVHEVLVHPSGRAPTMTVPGVEIRHEPSKGERSAERWARDEELLTAEIERDPTNTRAWFYLAKTKLWRGDREGAARAFTTRIGLGGWREEVFESLLERARLRDSEGDRILDLLSAAASAPHRAEPLCELADVFRARGAHHLALIFAMTAAVLPFPKDDALFVDRDVCTWGAWDRVAISAWYVGAWEDGERAAWEAGAKCPPEHKGRVLRNLDFYVRRKTQA